MTQFESARFQMANAPRALSVPEHFQGQQKSSHRGTGQARILCNFCNAFSLKVPLKALDDPKPASQGQDKVRITSMPSNS